MILLEGGNAFPDVEPFDHAEIPKITAVLDRVLNAANTTAIPIGSGATPTPGKKSGDLDVIVDEKDLLKHFGAKDAKTARKALRAMFDNSGLQTAQSGVSVHVRVPVGDSAHQVDIMVVPNAENAAKFHTHNIPKGSPFKGVNKHITLSALAKQKNMMWSPYQGLFARNEAGKKGDLVTDNIDEIAKTLLGPSASGKDLGSVESILAALGKEKGDALLATLRQDPNWKEIASESQLMRIKELAGL